MRALVVCMWLAMACDGGSSPPEPDRCNPPTMGLCGGELCGNNRIDSCLIRRNTCGAVQSIEACDGTNIPSCTALGYYGGTAICAQCTVDDSPCISCAPGVTCERFETIGSIVGVSVSGSHVAVTSANTLSITDGLMPITRTVVANVSDLAAIPGGWLIASRTSDFTTLTTAGVLGSSKPHPFGFEPRIASTGDRVIVVWEHNARALRAILDTSGNIVVAPAELGGLDGPYLRPVVTTDGTSFFVGVEDTLYRVAPDGTSTVTTGFPPHPVAVTWHGTTGWHITGPSYVAQRFDATGSLVGAPIALDLLASTSFMADGDDLISVRTDADKRLHLTRTAVTGTVVSTQEVGYIGESPSPRGFLARLDGNFVVAWSSASKLMIGLVAP